MIFSVLLELLSGCGSTPHAAEFDGDWSFYEVPGEPVRACIEEADVARLRELLIRCQENK